MSGDFEKAGSYFKKAEELSAFSGDEKAKSDLYINLAILQFEKKHYNESLDYAEKALRFIKEDKQGVVFLKARNLYMLGKVPDAFALYEKNWDKKEMMSRFDMNVYFDQCNKTKNYIRALEVLDTYQKQFEYVIGAGLQASQIYEQLGMIDEAILAAAMELEYLIQAGGIDKTKVQERLDDINKKLDDKSFNPKNLGKEFVRGLSLYFREDWAGAKEVVLKQRSSHQYYAYVRLVTQFESDGASVELLKDYVALEPYFKSLQGYYLHFWRGMKKGKGDYNLNVARDVLEKCVMLAPATASALETRREIARLIGLDPGNGDKLLLAAELDALLARLKKGEEPALLAPVLELVSIPDNVYTTAGVFFLRELSRNLPSVKSYLDKQKSTASGRLKERLVMILEG
jgi:hypothetical protein